MPDPDRILIIRPSALGDVCRTVPALVSLRRRYPGARIDWLVRDVFASAIAAHPDLGRAVLFPREKFRGWLTSPGAAKELFAWLGALRRERYDLVYDFQGLSRTGAFAFATRAPRRVGRTSARELGWLGLNVRHPVPRALHDVDLTLSLLSLDGVPPISDLRLYTSEADRAALDPRLRAARCALLAPTSRWEGKRWPADRFALLASGLLHDGLVERVAVVGAKGERQQCAPLLELASRDPRVVDLIGSTTVGGLMAAVEASSLVVANDSAALHMAVGFSKPLVALFGPTRVDRVGPYGRAADVLQNVSPRELVNGPRHKDAAYGRALMERISTDSALAACAARLSPVPLPAPTMRADVAAQR